MRWKATPAAKLAQVSRLATEQRALRRVATLVASEVSPERVFMAVSEECARVLHVNASIVVRYEGDDTATIVGRHNRDSIDVFRVGERLPPEAHSAVARVLKTGAPARVDDWGGLTGEMADAIFRVGYRSTAAVPIVVAGALWGAVAIASEDPLRADSEDRLVAFCELASLAVASAQARADLIASRARLVRAGDDQRRKLERNLHDGAQQRFVSVVLKLRLARARLASHPEATADLLEDAARELDTGLRELREIARGLHPAILGEQGLHARARGAGRGAPGARRHRGRPRAPARARRGDRLLHRLRGADQRRQARGRRRAPASRSSRDGAVLRCEISDDGRGGADTAGGTGILGLRDRAEAAGGTLSLVSPPGRGTVVTAVAAAGRARARPRRGRPMTAGASAGDGVDVVVRRPGQDRQPRGRAQRAVPVGVAQAAAQQAVELDDVRGAHGVGVGEDEHGRRLEPLDLGASSRSRP